MQKRQYDNIYKSPNGPPNGPDGPPNDPYGPPNGPSNGPSNGPDGRAGDRRLRPGELTNQGIMSPPIFVSWDQYSSLFEHYKPTSNGKMYDKRLLSFYE